MEIALVILVIIIVVVLASSNVRSHSGSAFGIYTKKPAVLSSTEQRFLAALEKVVGDRYRILCQVRVADVVELKMVPFSAGYRAALNRISLKSFDFLLCDLQSFEPVLVIELNDSTHERPDRVERDSFLNGVCQSIGLPIIFQKVQFSYDVFELQGRIAAIVDVHVSHASKLPDDAIPQVFTGVIPAPSEVENPNSSRTRRSVKIGYAIVSLVVIAAAIYVALKVVPESISSGLQSAADAGKKPANQAPVRPKAVRKEPLANQQRQAQESAASQREQSARDMATLQAEQEKEKAWQQYYQPSDKCQHATDWNVSVECGNEHIRAKRAFEEKWRAEH